ncbi:MAG: hypothetical protein JWM40_1689, partial [Frankiales bacterium]|nr:hypothetical protein [Frankiales bacterium]
MRISSLARRSVATLAATALLTTGGAVLGLTAGVANAQTVSGVSRIGGGPAVGVNNASSGFQIDGADFMPSGQEKVTIAPTTPPGIAGQGSIAGTVRDNSAQCTKNVLGSVSPDAHCNGPLLFDVNLAGAAPGTYNVTVVQTPQTSFPNTPDTDTCTGCLQVVSAGPATTTGIAPTGTTNGPVTITGTNFAHGAQVKWFNTDANGAATTVDPAFTLSPVNVVNATTITGTYSATAGAVGRKIVRVFNVDDAIAPGAGALFVQPDVGTLSPSTLGQGATAVPVTINGGLNGGGFDAQTTVSWTDPKVTTAGPIVVASNGNSLVVPTSVASDATVGPKTLVVKGTGGSYTTKSSALTVTAAPRPTSVSPASRGQGSDDEVTVNGSGFTASTVFSFGQGIIAETNPATTTATAAKVNLTIDPAAALGARNVTASNPDKGSTTLANGFTVVAKPVITSIEPPSGGPDDAVNVAITGHDFATSGGVTVLIDDPNITVGPVTVNSATLLHVTFSAHSADFGPHDVVVINNVSEGESTCDGCYGINSMTVSPTAGANNARKTLILTGPGLDGSS